MIGVVSRLAFQFDRVNRFGDAADLVELDQFGVGDAFIDSARQPLRIVPNSSSPTSWIVCLRGLAPSSSSAIFRRQSSAAHAVLDRNDGICSTQLVQYSAISGVCGRLVRRLEHVLRRPGLS